jgi:hypothetical protein
MQWFSLISGERVNLDHVVTIVKRADAIELNLDNGLVKVVSDQDGISRLESVLGRAE